MNTSITISERTRAKLDELQTAIERETGRTVPHQELLEGLVEQAHGSKEAVVEAFREDAAGFDAVEDDDWLSGPAEPDAVIGDEEIEELLEGDDRS